jgi:uncharacterized protein
MKYNVRRMDEAVLVFHLFERRLLGARFLGKPAHSWSMKNLAWMIVLASGHVLVAAFGCHCRRAVAAVALAFSNTATPPVLSSGQNKMTKKIMMILSPAKTLDMKNPVPPHFAATAQHRTTTTQPECNPATTLAVATAMKALSKAQLKTTLKISDALAVTTQSYWRDFGTVTTTEETTSSNIDDDNNDETSDAAATKTKALTTKSCIFAYSGAAYQGLDAMTCDMNALDYLQDRLRILSAVYGCLRPYDMIHPYRLEMNTKGIINNDESSISTTTTTAATAAGRQNKKKASANTMADVWREAATTYLAKDLQAADQKPDDKDKNNDSIATAILLNLASDEYAAAIDVSKLGNHVQFIKIIFLEPNGKVVTIHTKRARGLMVRYLADHQVETLEQVMGFDVEGYRYDEQRSDETTLVFQRTKVPPPPPSKETATKRRADSTTKTTTTTTTTKQKKKKTT